MIKKSSIRDIAERAGVSSASVSNVLNGKMKRVSAETAKRIQDLVTELDYQPDLTARGLSSGKSKMVGLVFPLTVKGEDHASLLGGNPFYGEFFDGVAYALRKRGYDILLAGYRQDQDCSDWVRRRGMDGVIFLGSYSRTMLSTLERRGVAVVLTDAEQTYRENFHCVGIDDEKGAYMATCHLVALGHRRIALAGGDITNSCINTSREAGYRRALADSGISVDERLIFRNTVSIDGGRQMADEMLNMPNAPSAVFAVADTIGIGILSVCHERNITVPDRLSVIGFDDLAVYRYLYPGLTTIRQDAPAKGKAAAEWLIDCMEGKNPPTDFIEIPIGLVERASTGPAMEAPPIPDTIGEAALFTLKEG